MALLLGQGLPGANMYYASNSGIYDYHGKNLSEDTIGQYSNLIYNYSNEIWNREDSAYQRMVADMQKAGLNPWTGISSGGSQTSSTNPAMDAFNGLMTGLNYNLEMAKLNQKDDHEFANFWQKTLKIISSIFSSFMSNM